MTVITKPILYLLLAAVGIVGTAYYMEYRSNKKQEQYKLELARLEGENRLITLELQEQKSKRLADKKASEASSARELAIREKLQREDSIREQRIRELENERASALVDFHNANKEIDNLPNKELGDAALSSLTAAYPQIENLQLTTQPDSYIANVPFIRATAKAGAEVEFLRFETGKLVSVVTELKDTQDSLVAQGFSHIAENIALLSRCLSCEDELVIRDQLEANLQQSLTVQADRMKALESKNLWGKIKRLEIPGGVSVRDIGIGYGLRVLTE